MDVHSHTIYKPSNVNNNMNENGYSTFAKTGQTTFTKTGIIM